MSLAYVKEPPLAKWVQRATLRGRYAVVTPGMSLLALPLILTGLVAEFVVLTGRYRYEWVALPFMTMCLAITVVVL